MLRTEVLKHESSLHILLKSQLKSQFWQNKMQLYVGMQSCPQPITEAFTLGKLASDSPQLWCNHKEPHQRRGNRTQYHSVRESTSKVATPLPENSHEVSPYRTAPPTPFFRNLGLICTQEVDPWKKCSITIPSELVPLSSADGPELVSALFKKY